MKVTKFTKDGELYLRVFLLDASENVNKWNVAKSTLARNIKTFLGTPFVAYINRGDEPDTQYGRPRKVGLFDHPPMDFTKTIRDNALYQEKFAIGRVTEIIKDASKELYDAIVKVTDAGAKEAIENHEVPFYVSARLINPDMKQKDTEDWFGMHVAVVSDPAYGVDKAEFKGACYGMAGECQAALKDASVQSDCGFCVKTELLKLATKDSSLNSSLSLPSPNLQPSMSAQPAQTIDTSKFVSMEEHSALKSQYDALKVVVDEAKQSYQKEIDALKEERRKEKISTIVSTKISDPKKAEETVKKFVDAKVSPEVVADAMALIPEQVPQKRDNTELFTGNVKDASANPRVGSYAKAQAYMNSIIRGASY